jgi:hypothetical protein
MTNTPGSAQFGRKLATAAATAATGFLCGWSALGLTGGAVLAVALCAGVAVPLFRGQGKPCPLRHRIPRQSLRRTLNSGGSAARGNAQHQRFAGTRHPLWRLFRT